MYALLLVVHVIVSLVLILVILLQAGKGGGLSEMFGGSSAQTFLGSKASDFLVKATEVCAIMFIVTSLSLTIMSSHRAKSLMERVTVPNIPAQTTQAPVPAPVETKPEQTVPAQTTPAQTAPAAPVQENKSQ